MLMGLQRHACSHRNQLAAPVDVFLIRLVTLHGGRPTAGHGIGAQFRSVARGPGPPHPGSACPSAPCVPHKQELCGLHSLSHPPSSPSASLLGCSGPVPSLC